MQSVQVERLDHLGIVAGVCIGHNAMSVDEYTYTLGCPWTKAHNLGGMEGGHRAGRRRTERPSGSLLAPGARQRVPDSGRRAH